MSYIIYKHTNKINGKCYIGQTCRKLKRRFNNGNGYKGQPLFYNAILKYGWENFSHEILEENISNIELANIREQYWIKFYHSYIYDPLCNGYNITPGGNNRDCYGKKVYKLDINKNIIEKYDSISIAARENNTSPDRISRCCTQQKGYKKSNKYFWCLEQDYKNYIINENKNNFRAILQLDENKNIINRFLSIKDAKNKLNLFNTSLLIKCLNKKSRVLNGYYWCFEDEYDIFIIPKYNKIKKIIKISDNLNNITIYKSIRKAAIDNNLNNHIILRYCNKNKYNPTYKLNNYFYMVYEDYINYINKKGKIEVAI